MKDSGANAFLQGYNAQIAVDGEAQVILAANVTNQVNDKDQMLPMMAKVKSVMGRDADVVLADAGYGKIKVSRPRQPGMFSYWFRRMGM